MVFYALAVLWFVATTPDPGIRCLLVDFQFPEVSPSIPGIIVRQIPGHPISADAGGPSVQPGDRVVQIGERPVYSFLDFSACWST